MTAACFRHLEAAILTRVAQSCSVSCTLSPKLLEQMLIFVSHAYYSSSTTVTSSFEKVLALIPEMSVLASGTVLLFHTAV